MEKAFKESDAVVVEGDIKTGAQHPFYLERLSAVVIPQEDGAFVVHSGVQNGTFAQTKIAGLLGVPMNKVTVKCKRMGMLHKGGSWLTLLRWCVRRKTL